MHGVIDSSELGAVRQQRRAIVFADLVESVRLMQGHEADAIDRWRRFVAQVREQILPARGGRLVRTAGDGLLIEFERGAAAVAAAHALHRALEPFNRGKGRDEVMLLRVGIHVSEVWFDEHEAYGAGVNLAHRLAGLAPPGGTIVSTEVRDELVDVVDGHLEDLGLRYVKHVDQPVRAFGVRPPGATAGAASALTAPAEQDLRPVVAVVPFSAIPADPDHDALGYAMADDIIAALARHPGLRVLSRASTAAVRDARLELPQLQRLLGASVMLSGRYYMLGRRVRLNVELCALKTGDVLWTGSAMADVQALFVGQDDLVPHIVAQVSQHVQAFELARVRQLPMNTLASYTLYLGASGLMNSLVPADFLRARDVLNHLIERHPRQAAPSALLAHWHLLRIAQGWATDVAAEGRLAQDQAQRALDLDAKLPMALVAAGAVYDKLHYDHVTARRYLDLAVEGDPSDPHAWAQLSGAQTTAGESVAALQSAQRAIDGSPLDPMRYLYESYAARTAFFCQRFGQAAEHAQASVRRNLLHAPSHRYLVASLWEDGRKESAREAAARFLAIYPDARAGSAGPPGAVAPKLTLVGDALRQAGLPQ